MSARLHQLPTGTRARIRLIEEGARPGIADRLREMGFGEGVEVEVLHRAPLGGDPVAVQVGGGVVAIRRAEARLVSLDLREAAE